MFTEVSGLFLCVLVYYEQLWSTRTVCHVVFVVTDPLAAGRRVGGFMFTRSHVNNHILHLQELVAMCIGGLAHFRRKQIKPPQPRGFPREALVHLRCLGVALTMLTRRAAV